MSVSVHQRACHVHGILALAIGATQTGRVSETQEEMFHLPATQPLKGGDSIVYGERTAMP